MKEISWNYGICETEVNGEQMKLWKRYTLIMEDAWKWKILTTNREPTSFKQWNRWNFHNLVKLNLQ